MNRHRATGRCEMPRGFATLTAVGLMALVAAALLALGAVLAVDARRTMRGNEDAQLRQMLLAGASATRAQVAQWGQKAPAEPVVVPLPKELTELQGVLEIRGEAQSEASRLLVRITARLNDRQMEQALTFERRDGAWRPIEAVLQSMSSVRATTKPAAPTTSSH